MTGAMCEAYFASGCFWGTEYFFSRAEGVTQTAVGYMGGSQATPSYQEVRTGETGHAETVQVLFDADRTTYEKLVRLFYETHDFTQVNRQGPDIGTQYRSVIFYVGDEQREVAEKITAELTAKGFAVATHIEPLQTFWIGEPYHQQYFDARSETPTCHAYRKIFE